MKGLIKGLVILLCLAGTLSAQPVKKGIYLSASSSGCYSSNCIADAEVTFNAIPVRCESGFYLVPEADTGIYFDIVIKHPGYQALTYKQVPLRAVVPVPMLRPGESYYYGTNSRFRQPCVDNDYQLCVSFKTWWVGGRMRRSDSLLFSARIDSLGFAIVYTTAAFSPAPPAFTGSVQFGKPGERRAAASPAPADSIYAPVAFTLVKRDRIPFPDTNCAAIKQLREYGYNVYAAAGPGNPESSRGIYYDYLNIYFRPGTTPVQADSIISRYGLRRIGNYYTSELFYLKAEPRALMCIAWIPAGLGIKGTNILFDQLYSGPVDLVDPKGELQRGTSFN